jgi:hypothetical protein
MLLAGALSPGLEVGFRGSRLCMHVHVVTKALIPRLDFGVRGSGLKVRVLSLGLELINDFEGFYRLQG